jgi:hypothetical protein
MSIHSDTSDSTHYRRPERNLDGMIADPRLLRSRESRRTRRRAPCPGLGLVSVASSPWLSATHCVRNASVVKARSCAESMISSGQGLSSLPAFLASSCGIKSLSERCKSAPRTKLPVLSLNIYDKPYVLAQCSSHITACRT